jgi:curved DNA-binding protein
MPVYGKQNQFGDLLVRINVQLPGELSPEELSLFRKLKNLNYQKVKPNKT